MSDKPIPPHGDFFTIPGWSVVDLRGPDAMRFAQAQFMSDVVALPAGHWQWSGWLTPKGRLVALFALVRLDDTSLLLLLADAEPQAFAAALSRFVFRSKVSIVVDDGSRVSGAFMASAAARGAAVARDAEGGLELDFGTAQDGRTLRIGATAALQDDRLAAEWRARDLAHGLPRLGTDHAGQWTPQQLSLERLRAYSVRKGCYPGQEIVARTHFLGQAKRGLQRLRADAAMPSGDVVAMDAPDRTLGRVVSIAGREGLAVMPLEAGAGPFAVDGIRCCPLPLLDGLAR
ncbi:YgfZ/GcvT domain-containing protein [Luteimonas saliphila]|uniref:CAF17-like 4Fe-4S cluster assembly/insertion protein YgfZ n=1 Tax=Luteimonas saliphila TaxID=2804919 RepID=UPI00192DA2CD|nr:folate-binding protein YgfZ [Luteimonas saliphila]